MSNQHAVDGDILPVPKTVQSLLIFGGSFDPPHRGHFELPPMARDRLGFDWLMYMPVQRSPFKEQAPSATDDQRLEMLHVGLDSADRTSVSTIELHAAPGAPSYTIDSLRKIRSALGPKVRHGLLIGEDQMHQFHKWKDARKIIQLAKPVVMLRDDDQAKRTELLESMVGPWSAREIELWGSRIVELPEIEASATLVRQLLSKGRYDDPQLRRMVPDAVLAIIDRDRLYRL